MRGRLVSHGRVNPVLLSCAAVSAVVDEGDPAVWEITVNWQGNIPVEYSFYLRRMNASEMAVPPSDVAGQASLTSSFFQAALNSVAAMSNVTMEQTEFDDVKITLASNFVGPFVFTWDTVDDPSQQGDKFIGLFVHHPSQGVVTSPSAVITINDATAAPPTVLTNVTLPTFSDDTPHVGETEVISGDVWDGEPSHRRFRVYRRRTGQGSSSYAAGAGGDISGVSQTHFDITNIPILRPTPGRHALLCLKGRTVSVSNAFVVAAPFADAVLVQTPAAVTSRQQNTRETIEWWVGPYPEGNTLSLSFDWSALMVRCQYVLFDLQDPASLQAHAIVKGTNPLAGASLAVPAGGSAFIAVGNNSSGSWNFTGVTLRKMHQWFSVASEDFAAEQAPLNIGVDYSGTLALGTMVALSFASAASGATETAVDSGFVQQPSYAHVLATTEEGFEIAPAVTARNAAGDSVEAVGAWIGPVAATPGVLQPVNVTVPAMNANPQVGVPITVPLGVWENDPVTYDVKVQENIASVWTDIAGADWPGVTAAQIFVPAVGNQGRTLRPAVRATNTGGTSAYVFGPATNAVAAAPSGTLTDVTLSFNGIAPGAAEGTVVGLWQPKGGQISSVAFLNQGNAGGRFKFGTTVSLQAGATAPTFRDPSTSPQKAVREYDIAVRFNGTLDRTFTIVPNFSKVAPTGGQGGATTEVSTLAAFRTQIQTGATARIVRIPESFIGIFETNSTAATADIQVGSKNFTVISHRRAWLNKDGPIRFDQPLTTDLGYAENIIFFNCLFGVGGDSPGYSYTDRDNISMRHGKNVLWLNCTFLYGVDESASVLSAPNINNGILWNYCQDVRFSRCYFARPMVALGTTPWHGETDHPVGLLIGEDNDMNLVVDKCVFSGFTERHPLISGRCIGTTVQNNLSVWHGASTRGITMGRRNEHGPFGSGIVRGNLIYNNQLHRTDLTTTQRNWIRQHHICFPPNYKALSPDKLYIPEGTDHDNWVLPRWDRPSSLGNRIVRADIGGGELVNQSIYPFAPSIATEEPFHTAMDDELMPTATLAQQQTLWDDVWLKVGCRELDGSDNIIAGLTNANQIQYEDQVDKIARNGAKTHCIPDGRGLTPTAGTPLATWPTTVPG